MLVTRTITLYSLLHSWVQHSASRASSAQRQSIALLMHWLKATTAPEDTAAATFRKESTGFLVCSSRLNEAPSDKPISS